MKHTIVFVLALSIFGIVSCKKEKSPDAQTFTSNSTDLRVFTVDAFGNKMADVEVKIFKSSGDANSNSNSQGSYTTTSKGEAYFSKLDEKEYFVRAAYGGMVAYGYTGAPLQKKEQTSITVIVQ